MSTVQVIADPRLLDLRADGIDLAIRFGRTPHPGYSVTRLMGDRVVPVCTPELLEQYGPVNSIDSMIALPLLHNRQLPATAATATGGPGSIISADRILRAMAASTSAKPAC